MKLQIKLYHQYSELDKANQFGIDFDNAEAHQVYIRWIWFFMGSELGNKRYNIYPYNPSDAKPKRVYKNCNDAVRQAKLLVNAMDSILNKSKK